MGLKKSVPNSEESAVRTRRFVLVNFPAHLSGIGHTSFAGAAAKLLGDDYGFAVIGVPAC